MLYGQIYGTEINRVDAAHVARLVESMLTNGWIGAPILYHSSIGLITGSHRFAALKHIRHLYDTLELTQEQIDMALQIDADVYALDVTEIVDEWIVANDGAAVEFDNLGCIFRGTEIEKWRGEIVEW